mgnify:CR=1 FL=1
MIVCSTDLSKKNIKALAKYHTSKTKTRSKKRVLTAVFGIFVFVVSLINAYGIWLKYSETESVIYILSKSSLLFILSLIIIHTSIWGAARKLYLDLNKYFTGFQASSIDYVITDEGIKMTITKNTTFYEWSVIDNIEADNNYYFFTCNGKHSIIDKNSLTSNDILMFEDLIKRYFTVK